MPLGWGTLEDENEGCFQDKPVAEVPWVWLRAPWAGMQDAPMMAEHRLPTRALPVTATPWRQTNVPTRRPPLFAPATPP
jgi:hypothetical protein